MKKYIIFALFSAFMVIAIAVGFYMQWNPTVIVVLLGMSFMGTICYLIGICRHLIMLRVIFCKEKIDKAYRKYIRKIAVNCSRKVNRWKLEDTGENHISLLSPIDDFKRHKEYIIRLKNAIDQPNVFNIALTGSYGAGKSSILKTFKAYYPEYHYVNVSLASFVEVNMSESDSTPKSNEDSFEEQLEYSILQQLFYHVKATNIPESRFGRIERTSRKKRIFVVVCILLFVVANLCLFCQEQVTKYFLIPTEVLKSSFLFGSSICIFILGICVILFQLILFIKKISIKNLTLDKATLEFEEKKNVSIMNRYLDEILYLFQEKKYNVVIFEDIDRFENTHIFTKLRELNLILNQSEEIGRRIVFLYALKDDIFANAEERTKFFDYIVPVIPFVNASNSGDLFRRKITDLHIPEAEVSSSFITDISVFVNDMRVLTNVVNEFDLYRNLLDKKLKKGKLLAMILYKNLYPTDFSWLHQNKGVVYETFMSSPKIRSEIREDDSDRLKEIDSEIQGISEETLRSIEELRAVIVGKLLKLWPGPGWDIYCDGRNIDINSLYSEDNIQHILKGNIFFRNSIYSNSVKHLNTDEIKATLGESYKYSVRKKYIQSVANNKIENLRDERRAFMDEMAAIDKYTLTDIAKSDRDIFEHVDIPKGQEEKYKVLKYFLEKGYIDEEYFFYISIFQEGRLTPSDQEFLLSIKFNTPKEFDYKLQEIPSLIQNLSVVDYDHKGILNKDLLKFCLLHEDEYEDECDAILKQMVVHEQYIDLLYQFMQEGNCVPTFIKRLVHIDKNVWKSLNMDMNHTNKDKDRVISTMFKYADINDIRSVNTSYPFNTYVNDNYNYPDLFEDIDQKKVRELLDLLDLNVQSLIDDSNAADTYSYIYENNMYALTLDNIKVIFKHNDLPVVNLDSAIYTSIEETELNELQDYVLLELPAFVENLMLTSSNTHESSDTIVSLMDEDINLDDIIKLIKHNNTLWDDCKDITDKDVVSTLFAENKIKMTFENVKHYCSCIGSWNIDGTLVAFMNCNEEKSMEEFTKLVESNDEHEKELLSSVVESDGINDKIAFSIFNNHWLIDVWSKELSQLNETRVRYVVDEGIITVSPSIYQDIIKGNPKLSKYLLCKDPDKIISEWDEFAFSITTVVEILSWVEYKKYHSFILDKIETESVTPIIANALLAYFSKSDSEFNLSLYKEAMEKSDNPALKILASTCCIAKRLIAMNELAGIFAKTKGIFEGLEKQGEVYSISKQVEGAQDFMEALHQSKYIGQVKEKGDYLTGKVLKRKPK
ncbi:hypothetical protein DXA63_14215 [Segatella copri]|uniref:YobI-like P-loop NTPase domain-containing protein n=1 Tax=Segatella copri TaxID=165179 RepID=A0AA93BIP5_9BACT|nr:hypothetical protein DXA63_14215 [Segatella copri]